MKKKEASIFCSIYKASGCFLCFAAWMGAFGRGHVWSQAEPTAACSANRLGGAAGQSRTDFLCQSRNQNHPVVPTHSAVREVASVLFLQVSQLSQWARCWPCVFTYVSNRDSDVERQRRQCSRTDGEHAFITRRQISETDESSTRESPDVI